MRPGRSGTPWRPALCVLLALVLAPATLGLMTSGTLAQQNEAAPDEAATVGPRNAEDGEQKERKRSQEPIEVVHADHATVEQFDERDESRFLLEGNVHLRQEDVNLFADVVTMDQGKETAEATGNLRVVDPENVIVGDFLAADFDEGRITLTGNVRLVHEETEAEDEGDAADANEGEDPPAQDGDEPDADGGEPKKKTVVICDRLHYYYDDKRAICVGNVVAQQE
ncbi:MAG: LptA/OstA family protein, partial [Armatimonadota bacterium]